MRYKRTMLDAVFSVVIYLITFAASLLLQMILKTETMIPTVFVLGVFLIAWRTQGYLWGVAASCVSVLTMNFAFTIPYYAFDLTTPECISAAVVMLIVSVLTSTLTTQVKRQEKLRAENERERMRANLLRAVSHDLRTPLTAIYGASSTILENYDTLNQTQKLELLKDVQTDSQWLIRMVENLLSVTRIDGENVALTKIPTVLEELLDTVLVKFQKRFPEQAVQLDIPEEFVSIPMDAMLIEQVLTNLLENAVFHAKGMTELKLSVTCHDGFARFCVQDNGCGIPQERLEHLFTGSAANRNAPTDGRRSNMGIGLSVCAAIVKAHGSEIQARPLLPQGTEFTFSLEMEAYDEHESI